MVRIDTPETGTKLQASAPPLFGPRRETRGRHTIAGIAYAGRRGISGVEYSADEGKTWRNAELLDAASPGADRWVRWSGAFDMPAGASLSLVARATDGTGEVQTRELSFPEPDGGTGWPRVQVSPA
jgi:hypothetical protein